MSTTDVPIDGVIARLRAQLDAVNFRNITLEAALEQATGDLQAARTELDELNQILITQGMDNGKKTPQPDSGNMAPEIPNPMASLSDPELGGHKRDGLTKIKEEHASPIRT